MSESSIIESVEEEEVNVLPELNDEDSDGVSVSGNEWTSVKLVPIDKITCHFPNKLLESINQVDWGVKKKIGDTEFSVFIHGEFNHDGIFVVSEDFYIPKQKVGTASVDYLEEPEEYYNGCLHKHPKGVTSFSGTDKKYINSNFEFSILYLNNKIQTGIINIPYYENRRLQTTMKIVVPDHPMNKCPFNIDNIEKVQKNKQIGFGESDVVIPSLINEPLSLFQPHVVQGEYTTSDKKESKETEVRSDLMQLMLEGL